MFITSHRDAVARGAREESGFTVIEMVIAVVILLIAFSGIMSLTVANTYMNVAAKQKAALVNEANSYIERVRQMKYDDIGTPSGTPSGLLASYTTTTNGFVITVVPTVAPMTDPKIVNTSGVPLPGVLKKLSIDISAHRVGTTAPVLTYHAETIVKKTDSGISVDAELPTTNPTASTPTSDAVVYGNAVSIGAVATANGDGVYLTSMNFYCDGVPLISQSGLPAQWALNTVSYTSPTFLWDTTAVNEDGVPLSDDGSHAIKLEVWDSNGRQSWYQWNVIVDNTPPIWPADGWITATPLSSTSMNLAWSAVYDGNSPTHHYNVASQKWVSAAWAAPVTSSFTGVTGVGVTTPFSKYQYTVSAVGPPTQNRESATNSQVIAISRPEILSTSTWRNYTPDSKNIYTLVTIKLSPPTFPVPMGTKSTLYKSTSPSMNPSSTVGAAFAGWTPAEFMVDSVSDNGWPAARQYYYQVVTSFGASGPYHYSQVVGPNGSAGAGATPFTTVRW